MSAPVRGRARIVCGLLLAPLLAACSPPLAGWVGSEYYTDADDFRRLMADSIARISSQWVPERLDAPLVLVAASRPVTPRYPLEVLRIEGDVEIAYKVSDKGEVEDVVIVSSPHIHMSAAARLTVLDFKFKPPTKDGKPTSIQVRQSLTYRRRR